MKLFNTEDSGHQGLILGAFLYVWGSKNFELLPIPNPPNNVRGQIRISSLFLLTLREVHGSFTNGIIIGTRKSKGSANSKFGGLCFSN